MKQALEEYFSKRPNYNLQGFGRYRKEQISRGTGLFLVEVFVEQRTEKYYALVTTSRARPQGIIVLNATQISTVVKMLIDGLDEEF